MTSAVVRRAVRRGVGGMGVSLLLAWLAALVLSVCGWTVVQIRGGSMRPSIPYGAALIAAPPSGHDLVPGNVLTVRAVNGALVTHRVHEVADGTAAMKGDANEVPDVVRISQAQVVGVPKVTLTGAPAAMAGWLVGPVGRLAVPLATAVWFLAPTVPRPYRGLHRPGRIAFGRG